MPLPWVRLDCNVASHDKILALLSDPSPKRWQAASSYFFALGWSGGQGTDGYIPSAALGFIHGTPATCRLLVAHHLWDEGENGWQIRNWEQRQQLNKVSEAIHKAQSQGARKGNCRKHHIKGCECWKEGDSDQQSGQ